MSPDPTSRGSCGWEKSALLHDPRVSCPCQQGVAGRARDSSAEAPLIMPGTRTPRRGETPTGKMFARPLSKPQAASHPVPTWCSDPLPIGPRIPAQHHPQGPTGKHTWVPGIFWEEYYWGRTPYINQPRSNSHCPSTFHSHSSPLSLPVFNSPLSLSVRSSMINLFGKCTCRSQNYPRLLCIEPRSCCQQHTSHGRW